ncbi:MAG TPA: hypothetical protein GX714_17330 [Chloroflexi bacterium]|nr:hypothetical protein [Chloroflexota bacterium]
MAARSVRRRATWRRAVRRTGRPKVARDDLGDAQQIDAAERNRGHHLVTRNMRHLRQASEPTIDAAGLAALLRARA